MTSIRERFDRFVVPVTEAGCLLWMGCWDSKGYGVIYYCGRPRRAARVAIEIETGRRPLPSEYVLHHCDTPACVNPDHLYIGTQSDNVQDCLRRGRHNHASKTHCKYGHALSDENVTLYKTERRCRACERRRSREKYAQNKAQRTNLSEAK